MTISSSSSTHEIALTCRPMSHTAHSPTRATTIVARSTGSTTIPTEISRTRVSIGETGRHGRSPPRRVTSAGRAGVTGVGSAMPPVCLRRRRRRAGPIGRGVCLDDRMGRVTTRVRRTRLDVDTGGRVARTDTVAVEEPLEIRIGDEPLTTTMRTPGDDFDLTIGHLLTEAMLHSAAEVGTLMHCTDLD